MLKMEKKNGTKRRTNRPRLKMMKIKTIDTKRRKNQPCLHVAALALDRVHTLMGAHLLGQGELAVVDVNSDDVPGRNLI